MRKMIMMLMMGTVLASPVLAQSSSERWRDQRDTQTDRDEIRRDRQEVRDSARAVAKGRQEVAEALRRGDHREARQEMRELQRDHAELQRNRAELRQDQGAVVADQRNDRGYDRRADWLDSQRNWRDGDRDWQREGYRNWHRDWRSDNRYDWNRWRDAHRDRFRAPRYWAPRHDSYQRWSIGIRIDPFLFSNRYWINDPGYYRLPPAYGPYRWVRYYDDVMLVDMRTGLIADIIYDFFW